MHLFHRHLIKNKTLKSKKPSFSFYKVFWGSKNGQEKMSIFEKGIWTFKKKLKKSLVT